MMTVFIATESHW